METVCVTQASFAYKTLRSTIYDVIKLLLTLAGVKKKCRA